MSLSPLLGRSEDNSETFIRREGDYVQAYKYSTPEALHVWTPADMAEETVA